MSHAPADTTIDRINRVAMRRILKRVVGGLIEVSDAGETRRYGMTTTQVPNPEVHVHIDVHDPRTYGRVLREGSIGLGESYADGLWDTDDLTGLLRLANRNLRRTQPTRDQLHRLAGPLIDPVARLRRPDKQRDRRNVRTHYDIGNEFFRRILDDSMMYSCAVFDRPDSPLGDASRAKLDRLAQMLELSEGDRVLDIGTGWGGFAVHAAQHYGCRVTATTISQRQYEYARNRVREAGLEHLITVVDQDYRDVRGTYDKAIAIEMIEAVDWRDYDTFFETIRSRLTDDGMLAVQAITVPDESFDRIKRHTDFIKAVIFPGGCLPSIEALTAAARRSGEFALIGHDDIGLHYAETLRRWRANLEAVRHELPLLGLDDRFGRLWQFYFAYCEAGFDERYISAAQLLYTAPMWRPRAIRRIAPSRALVATG
ncbi:MAG: cyclopropane-fatty-acyl-phospholipid synthase family protein [Acidimicrobiales bacterium]